MARGYRFGVVGSLSTVPNGKTVLPVNDIDLLLQCAGIKGSTITTLAELFADTTTLQAVINSNNAIDYLVRSTEFAKSEALVPTMTSDTEPSGECISNGYRDNTYRPYKAFDGSDSSEYESNTNNKTSGEYIGYIFQNAVKVQKIHYIGTSTLSSATHTETLQVQRSSDGTNWDTLKDNISLTIAPSGGTATTDQTFSNTNKVKYYRVYLANSTQQIRYSVKTVQFYTEDGFCDNTTAMQLIGANNYASNTLLSDSTWLNAICNSTYFESVLNAKVPTMTSNTAPSGVCSGSTADSGAEYYKAFDNDFNALWCSTTSDNNAYVQYEFAFAITVNKLSMCPYITNRGNAVRQFVLSASNDGFVNDSHDLFTSPDYSNSTTVVFTFTINEAIQNSTAYKYYRVRVLSSYDTSNYKGIRELQLYGREDV